MVHERKNRGTIGGVVFIGCLFIGLALGMLYSKTVIGILLGLGIGFVAMGVIWAFYGKK